MANSRVIITNEDDDAKVSVAERGLKGALSVEIVDASGNQITSFAGDNSSVSTIGSALPTTGTYIGLKNGSVLVGGLGDADGHFQCDILSTASHAVTNAGTFAVQEDGSALTALQLIDDIVYVDDADWTNSNSKHALVGGLYQSTPQSVTDGDVAPFQADSHGNIKSVITDGTDIALVDGSGNLMVSLGTEIAGEDVTNDYLKVGGSIAENAAANASHYPVLIGGRYDSSPRTLGNGDVGAIALDAAGHLQVDVLSGGGAGTQYTEDIAAPADPVGGTTMMTTNKGYW